MGSILEPFGKRLRFTSRFYGGMSFGADNAPIGKASSNRDGDGSSIVASRRTKSTSPNTHQAQPCINSAFEIKVSVDALLQLARWCCQQQADSNISASSHEQGGSSCQPTSPPAPIQSTRGNECDGSLGPTLGTASAGHAGVIAHATDASVESTAHSCGKGGSR